MLFLILSIIAVVTYVIGLLAPLAPATKKEIRATSVAYFLGGQIIYHLHQLVENLVGGH